MITEIIFVGNRIDDPNRLALQLQISIALKNGSDEVHIRFGSQGGEIFQALEFYKFITNLPSEKKTKLHVHSCGPIQSAAVVFFLSFDNRYISDSSSFMMHKVRLANMTALTDEQQENIELFNVQMIDIITDKVNLEKNEIYNLRETYLDVHLTSKCAVKRSFGKKLNRVFQNTAVTIPPLTH